MSTKRDKPALAEADIETELKNIRRRGLLMIGEVSTRALEQAVYAAGHLDSGEPVGPYVIEQLMREAVAEIGGDLGDLAAIIFGLDEGGRSASPPDLRKAAAAAANVSPDYFRQSREPKIISAMAQIILGLVHRHQLHLSRLRMDTRTPVGSRLAVEWLSRFEAMYAIWTPLTGVGNDLTAARSTMLDPDRVWDEEPDPDDPESTGWSQERQAQGYVRFALYHYTQFQLRLREFKIRFGGLWLLPEAQAENDIADAVHRIELASVNNQLEDSYLRSVLAHTPGEEVVPFLDRVHEDPTAIAIHNDWQAFAASCTCQWEPGERAGRELFPIPANHPGVDPHCDMHLLITACNDYCLILDDAWDQIADWYHEVPKPQRVDVTGEQIYAAREQRRMRFDS